MSTHIEHAIRTENTKDKRLCREFVFTFRISIIYPEYFGEFWVVETTLPICERAREESLNLQGVISNDLPRAIIMESDPPPSLPFYHPTLLDVFSSS